MYESEDYLITHASQLLENTRNAKEDKPAMMKE
jgi:hypothetical protein